MASTPIRLIRREPMGGKQPAQGMPMSIEQVSHTRYAKRYRRYRFSSPGFDGVNEVGEDVHMKDGSVWFHPYTGAQPRKIQ